jgi:hypothetical protein
MVEATAVKYHARPFWAIGFVCLFLSLAGQSRAAIIHFDGVFDPINWTISEIVDLGPPSSPPSFGDGSVTFSGGAPATTLDLAGSDTLSGNNVNTLIQITIPTTYFLSFDWAYNTTDSGGPVWDMAGYILNGIFTQLSDDAGANSQAGSILGLAVVAGDVFGFYVDSVDDDFGRATLTIDTFVAEDAPEPSTVVMLISGLSLIGIGRLRRKG